MLSPQPPVTAKAATAALPAPAAPRAATSASFAQMLTEQAPATPPAPPPAATAPAPAKAPTPAPAQPHDAPPAPPAATAKPPTGGGTNKPPQGTSGAKGDAGTDKTGARAATSDKAGRADAADKSDAAQSETDGLDELTSLIGLAGGAGAPLDAAAAAAAAQAALQAAAKSPPVNDGDPAHATGQANVDHAGNATATRAARNHGDAGAGLPADAARGQSAASADLAARDEKSHAAGQQLLKALDAPALPPRLPLPADGASPGNFAATLQAAVTNAAPTATGAGTGTSSTSIGAPLHSTAFAPEVAASVSVLAADGVQQAELQLNPTDMGPVSVQIVLDGAQAQVSFHAAQAETRQALEKSLPDLAAALQGQGLTLSGGGVFQQAPQQRNASESGERDSDGSRGSRTASRAGGGNDRIAGTAATAVRRQVGLVDTFA